MKSCQGSWYTLLATNLFPLRVTNLIVYYRSLLQDTGSVLGCVPSQIHGHFLELRLRIQFRHENILHRFYFRHNICNEIQEAILFGKSIKTHASITQFVNTHSYLFRLMINWAMISLTSKHWSQPPSSSHWFATQHTKRRITRHSRTLSGGSSCSGAWVYGLRHSPSSHKLLCLIKLESWRT